MKCIARRSGSSASNPESTESSEWTHNFLDALSRMPQQVYMALSHRKI
jgi:hypothetical protein